MNAMNTIEQEVIRNFSSILGLDSGDTLDVNDSLLEIGADSLALMKCIDFINDRYGVSIAVNQVYQDFHSVGDIISYVDRRATANIQRPAAPAPSAALVQVSPPQYSPAPLQARMAVSDTGLIQEILRSQVSLMEKHLNLLDRIGGGISAAPAIGLAGTPAASRAAPPALPEVAGATAGAEERIDRFNVFAARTKAVKFSSERQVRYLDEFVAGYCRKFKTSKMMTQKYRHVLADNRASAGFKPHTKELTFPILAERSQGAHIWDVDGNRLLDITMGFGVHLFGHNPEPVKKRIAKQLKNGFPIGPQSPLAGRVSELICELTGHERVVFCNSGSEATMTAIRMARAHTGRSKIVIFSESYHGTFDGFLARTQQKDGASVSTPVSAGVVESSVQDTVVLEYGDPAALETIRQIGSDLAAVIVEPVQSRRPWLQPKEFLQSLRDITTEKGVVFIWDEVITGFRIAAGGAQEHFGIKADLASYGKIAGGGMPIGLIAGDARILDLIDGGYWAYGDDSVPQSDQIFFAGTFTKHPLTMAAAIETLETIASQKDTLYADLNAKTRQLAEASNALFQQHGVDIKVECFGSLFRYVSRKNIDLFFSHLMMEGVYVWEGRNCFLSTAHSSEDLATILDATRKSIVKLLDNEILERKAAATPVSVKATAWERRFCKLWQAPSTRLAVNIGGGLFLENASDIRKLEEAVHAAVGRCESLKVTFDPVAGAWTPAASGMVLDKHDQAATDKAALQTHIKDIVRQQHAHPFALADAPLRVGLHHFQDHGILLTLVANHCVCDGASFAAILDAILSFYSNGNQGGKALATAFGAFSRAEGAYLTSSTYLDDGRFWKDQLTTYPARFDAMPPPDASGTCTRREISIGGKSLIGIAKQRQATPYAVLLTAFNMAMQASGLTRYGVIGVPVLNRDVLEQPNDIGQITNILPLRPAGAFAGYGPAVAQTKEQLRQIRAHGRYALIELGCDGTPCPSIAVSVNMEPGNFEFPPALHATAIFGDRPCIEFPVEVNIVREIDAFRILCDIRQGGIKKTMIDALLKEFKAIIKKMEVTND